MSRSILGLRLELLLAALVCALLVITCAPPEKSPVGFRLPDGDVEAGRIVFDEMKCHACHMVRNEDFPPPIADPPVPVVLGGLESSQISDGYLVTAVINPNHRIGRNLIDQLLAQGDESRMLEIMSGTESRMPDYSEVMTVRELADLVAFLHTRYEIAHTMPPH